MKTEREFIHDLSNPLAIADGKIRALIRRLENGELTNDMDKLKSDLEKISNANDRLRELLKTRRAELHAQEAA